MRRRFLIGTLTMAVLMAVAPQSSSAAILEGYHQVMTPDGRCLDVDGAAGWNGAEVRVSHCVNGANQRWRLVEWFEPNHDGWDTTPDGYKLRVQHTGKCLSVQWQPWSAGSNVVQDVCAEATLWYVTELSGGWTRIMTSHASNVWCLDKTWWDVTVWGCHDGWWQKWQSLG